MSTEPVDEIKLGGDTGFYEIQNGEDFTEYGTVVATEKALYGAKGAADIEEFEPHYGEENVAVVGGSRLENGWATGNAKDPEVINELLEQAGTDKRVNPDGVVFEPRWKTDLPEDYLDESGSASDRIVQEAIEQYEIENNL